MLLNSNRTTLSHPCFLSWPLTHFQNHLEKFLVLSGKVTVSNYYFAFHKAPSFTVQCIWDSRDQLTGAESQESMMSCETGVVVDISGNIWALWDFSIVSSTLIKHQWVTNWLGWGGSGRNEWGAEPMVLCAFKKILPAVVQEWMRRIQQCLVTAVKATEWAEGNRRERAQITLSRIRLCSEGESTFEYVRRETKTKIKRACWHSLTLQSPGSQWMCILN